jgi:phage terminase large subunit-like protein
MPDIPMNSKVGEIGMNLADIQRELARRAGRKMDAYYPNEGMYRRELYVPHMKFLKAGATHRERVLCAANRCGKSDLGAYESVCHLTGLYPAWWEGKRFETAVKAWAAGDTSKTVRSILQDKLLGPLAQMGTGMIPKEYIHHVSRKTGVADAIEQIWVRHISGGISHCELKSYDQRREAFQGTSQHVIWLDEEPPMDIYTECVLRTATTDGVILCTFTPLQGMTELLRDFFAEAERG